MASAPDDIHVSHYALLGIPIDADAGQIRGAYLRLMKKSHPDLRRRRTRKSLDPTAINEAYRVLRDPRRRMAYDLTLRRGGDLTLTTGPVVEGGSIVRIARRMPPPPPPASLSRRLAMGFCILLVGGAAGLILSLPQPAGSRTPSQIGGAAALSGGGAPAMAASFTPEAMPTNLWVDAQMVTRAVDHLIWIRRFGRPVDALRYSRNCFDELGNMPSPLLLDHCVAFDLATAGWLDGRAEPTIGFSPRDIQIRHRAALARLPEADTGYGQRLSDIKQATTAALVRRIDPEAAPPPEEMTFPAAPASQP